MGEEITDWLGTNIAQAHDLDTKLRRLPTLRNAGSRTEFRDRLFATFLRVRTLSSSYTIGIQISMNNGTELNRAEKGFWRANA